MLTRSVIRLILPTPLAFPWHDGCNRLAVAAATRFKEDVDSHGVQLKPGRAGTLCNRCPVRIVKADRVCTVIFEFSRKKTKKTFQIYII